MLQAVVMMGGLGLIVGAGLAVASKIFYVYVDPLILEIDDALPGANCGGCGYPGCGANAEAIVAGQSPPNSCVAAGAETAEAIAAILGVSVEATEPDISKSGCTYGVSDAAQKFLYDGIDDCRAAALMSGGMKVCTIGCMGLGSCARACQFDALEIGPDGLPRVDEEKCTGCGACERVCPKHIITLSSVTRRILREYTTEDCTTPCQRACPAGIDICEYIRQIQIGDYRRSVQIIKERNPFPTVIGRICPRPCEQQCRRQFVDEPVAINFLKRFVADYERQTDQRIQPYAAPATQRQVAVIGGGVQGLSAAFFCARLGHSPTVFEAADQLGGLLRSAIARNRLPMDVLDWDIDGILDLGVQAKTNQRAGSDFTIAGLLADGFETVLLSTGGWDSRLANPAVAPSLHSPAAPGCFLMIDILKAQPDAHLSFFEKQAIAVIGSGDPALQTVHVALSQHASSVSLVCRENRDQCGIDAQALADIEKQGANLIFNARITGLRGIDNALQSLTIVAGSENESITLPASKLIVAAGRLPELIFSKTVASEADESSEPETFTGPIAWQACSPYKNPVFGHEIGFLAPGDPLTDFSGAIKAIAAGRRAAASMHKVMYGIALDLDDQVITQNTVVQNIETAEKIVGVNVAIREIMPLATHSDTDNELELGFSEATAKTEAERCLQCGLICYRHQ